MQIGGVQVATLEVLVESQNLVLVDVSRQLGLDVLSEVVQNVLWRVLWIEFAICIITEWTDQEVYVISCVCQILRPIAIVNHVLEVSVMLCELDVALSADWNPVAQQPQLLLCLLVLLRLTFSAIRLLMARHLAIRI